MRIKHVLLLLLAAISHLNAFPSTSPANVNTMLSELDTYLANSQQYVERKEKQIAQWHQRLKEADSDKERYRASIRLFEEYKSYKYDSAYTYAHHSLQLAQQMESQEYMVEANSAIAFCLLSSGLFKEAFDVMKQVDITDVPVQYKILYYTLYSRLHYDIADYNREAPFRKQYITTGGLYTDSLLALIPEKSSQWWYAIGQRQMKEQQYNECIHSFKTLLQRQDVDLHTEAIIASSLGWVYSLEGEQEQAIFYLKRAAICDIRASIKETTALCVLANLLFKKGDTKHANHYIQAALEDANAYNARHRKIEVGSILPIIEQGRFDTVRRQRNLLLGGIALFLLLSALLTTTLFIIRKQMKKLHMVRQIVEERNRELQQTNEQLVETNTIKDEYIGHSFYLNAEYIEKMENLHKMVNRKIVARQFEALQTLFKEHTLNQERENMYASFDKTFLKLFPGFIDAYNRLFPDEENNNRENEQSLTSEMRIFALIRLGICESERIAKFLNYSVHTINTYKTRIKNKSIIPNELFEAKIMEIAAGPHSN